MTGIEVGIWLDVTFQAISAERGVKNKQRALKESAESAPDTEHAECLLKTLKYAYDTSIRFGISPDKVEMPATNPREPRDFGLWIFQMLEEVMNETKPAEKKRLIEKALAEMDTESRAVLMAIVAKDLRCGINESTIRKVFSNLLTEFSVMLAKPFASRHVSAWPVVVEPKLDGLRCIAEVNTASREVDFFTRSGKPITSLDNFKKELLHLAFSFGDNVQVAFDGEVTSGSFLESMSSVRKSDTQVEEGTFHIFDALVRPAGNSPIALTDEDLQKQGTYKDRRDRLMKAWLDFKKKAPAQPKFLCPTQAYQASTEEEVMGFYARFRDAGLEGAIVKDPASYYVKKRSSAWLKLKAEETLDLPIVGAFEGTGQFQGALGGIIVLNGEVEVKVGSGFSADQRREFWDAIQRDSERIAKGERERCDLIDCIAEVQFQEQLPSGSLRHPVFVRLRRDKTLGAVGAF